MLTVPLAAHGLQQGLSLDRALGEAIGDHVAGVDPPQPGQDTAVKELSYPLSVVQGVPLRWHAYCFSRNASEN